MRKNTRARTTSVKWNINRNIWSVNLNSCLNFTFLIVPRKTWMKNKHSQSSWRIIIPNTKVTHFEKKKEKEFNDELPTVHRNMCLTSIHLFIPLDISWHNTCVNSFMCTISFRRTCIYISRGRNFTKFSSFDNLFDKNLNKWFFLDR